MLLVARDADENVALERDHRFRSSLRLDVQRLTSRECRQLEPGLAPGIRGGVLAEGDAQVDPRRLAASLMRAGARRGVRFVCDRAALLVEAGRAVGVRLASGGVLRAPATVLAAGAWTSQLPGLPAGVAPPIRPVKGQVLRLRGTPSLITRIVRDADVYIVPRGDGRYVVGATVEERGFDTSVTAGAVHRLLRDATELVPDVAELTLSSATAGLRPGTPDNAPVVGRTELRGLLIAAGHYRNGVLLAPITADTITALLTETAVPEEVAPFTPARFAAVPQVVG